MLNKYVIKENEIKRWIEGRKIEVLLHFTRVDNLNSILRDRLLSVQSLEEKGIDVIKNDHYRYDGHEDSSSISITFPNYKMFYKLRHENMDAKWVVIGLKPDILWEKDCAFCIDNAASNTMSYIDINIKKDLCALQDMFSEYRGQYTRKQMGIEDCCTTNPQAEVLVFDCIEPKYFLGIVYQDENLPKDLLKKYNSDYNIVVVPDLFLYRDDYSYWQSKE